MKSPRVKIFFAPNWGLSSTQMVEDYLQQSSGGRGQWGNIEATTILSEADYLIIQDECPPHIYNAFAPSQRLYFSREALTPAAINPYPADQVVRSSFWDDSGMLWVKWWYPNRSAGGINKTYDELTAETENPYVKNKLLSCIQSDKRMVEGHHLRYRFLENFMQDHGSLLDLYGSINFKNCTLPDNDKFYALHNYKYCLSFDNQDHIGNFFGTQFTDSILYWTVPIYWGGANLDKFFPKDSFIQMDIRKQNEKERIVELLQNESYEKRLPALAEARDLILNKYNMWPIINNVIANKVSKK